MASTVIPETAISVLREVIVALVRRDGPALSAHQLAVYLTCYMKERDHTVRGLASDLSVSKSVVTRALDKLGDLGLVRRKPDPSDRRSILVERTDAGHALLGELQMLAEQATRDGAMHAAAPSNSHEGRPAN